MNQELNPRRTLGGEFRGTITIVVNHATLLLFLRRRPISAHCLDKADGGASLHWVAYGAGALTVFNAGLYLVLVVDLVRHRVLMR